MSCTTGYKTVRELTAEVHHHDSVKIIYIPLVTVCPNNWKSQKHEKQDWWIYSLPIGIWILTITGRPSPWVYHNMHTTAYNCVPLQSCHPQPCLSSQLLSMDYFHVPFPLMYYLHIASCDQILSCGRPTSVYDTTITVFTRYKHHVIIISAIEFYNNATNGFQIDWYTVTNDFIFILLACSILVCKYFFALILSLWVLFPGITYQYYRFFKWSWFLIVCN